MQIQLFQKLGTSLFFQDELHLCGSECLDLKKTVYFFCAAGSLYFRFSLRRENYDV